MAETVRVRFAPSPTGELHVGGLRTALFNWLFARHHHGRFIVRLEDTDRERFVPGSADRILAALSWLGLDSDEGPGVGGPHGPYVQSERTDLYRQAAQQLLQRGAAYECFCTPDRLEAVRAEQSARRLPTRYDRRCRSLPPDERAQRRLTEPHVIRLAVPEQGTLTAQDVVRGRLSFSLATVDDQVLLKSDGFPTYHLANVVDDHAMGVTHVIRAEEWLSSLPKHLILYQAFGWTPPVFAHLSLLLGADRSKLSKRHGATSVQQFIEGGYLPEAMLNFLALLGWNPGGDRELMTRAELIAAFSLERVQPSGAVFDRVKLDWMNLQYLKRLPAEEFGHRLVERLAVRFPETPTRSDAWVATLVTAVRDRIKRFADADALVAFAFERPTVKAADLIPKGRSPADAIAALRAAGRALERVPGSAWSVDDIRTALDGAGEGPAVRWAVRVAVTGQHASPPVYDSVALTPRTEVLERLHAASALFSSAKS